MKRKIKYKNIIIVILSFMCLIMSIFIINHYHTFNHHKVKKVTKIRYKKLIDENIVFLGDSITDFYDLDKYYEGYNVVNSGINGDTAPNILKDMKGRVYRYNPSKVFILIGTNQMWINTVEEINNNIQDIVKGIQENRKLAKVYVISIYPVSKKVKNEFTRLRDNEKIQEVNKLLKKNSITNNYVYIDMYSKLVDDVGNLKYNYTKDGLHLNDDGYKAVSKHLMKYVKE